MILPPPRPILRQTLIVAVAGIALGLLANAVSPRGLSLTRNYFLDTPAIPAALPARPAAPAPVPAIVPRQTKRGLPLIDHSRAAELLRDPRRAAGLILFIDARNAERYARGHIPGAHLLDHYRLELYVGDIIGFAQLAQEIVVYCNGGDCEDSDLVALDLQQLGVPAGKISVYGGGFDEWQRLKLPVETGARGSGVRPNP